MSLSVWKASAEEKAAWYEEIKNDERLAREAEQNAELDEFERAEIARDMECGDWDANDLREGEPRR